MILFDDVQQTLHKYCSIYSIFWNPPCPPFHSINGHHREDPVIISISRFLDSQFGLIVLLQLPPDNVQT